MGKLIVGNVDFNDKNRIIQLENGLKKTLSHMENYFSLIYKPSFYFSTRGDTMPSTPGWYVLLEGSFPIYVGMAVDLNSRLNSNNGSSDNFATKNRTSDPERNFVKKLAELGILTNLRVAIITENQLLSYVGDEGVLLNKLDRQNIEKFLNVTRFNYSYL